MVASYVEQKEIEACLVSKLTAPHDRRENNSRSKKFILS